MSVNVFWDPAGFQLDSLGRSGLVRISDGDTPTVTTSIRMLSIDTPELHYPGNSKPSKQDGPLQELADWIRGGKAPIDDGLAAFLHPRLNTGTAGTRQEQQGTAAKAYFAKLLDERLKRPSGRRRSLFLWVAEEPFDRYGRLLAYVAPSYSSEELAEMTRVDRATFNALMVRSGWAAMFPIYPSLPKHEDLVLLHDWAKEAVDAKRGAWADSETLTGYEFRMCVKLYDVTKQLNAGRKLSSRERSGWVTRYCVDIETREIFYPQQYHHVPVHRRVFVWPQDVVQAVARLNLVPPQ